VYKVLDVYDKCRTEKVVLMTVQNLEFYTGNIEAFKIEKGDWHNM